MSTRFGLALIALVIGQSLFLSAMVRERVALLRSDRVVTLKSEPVDPRDLLRGDYVVLSYTISRLALDSISGDDDFKEGDTAYVELAPDDGTWKAVAAWHEQRAPRPGNEIIRGRVTSVIANDRSAATTASVAYGIESYFVPEGEGRELENKRNAGALTVDVALSADGTAAIKQLRLDGKPVYEEPLF